MPDTQPARFKIAAIQMNSGDDVDQNLRTAERLLDQAAEAGAALAVLPEFFSVLSADEKAKIAVAEADGSGKVQDFLAHAARSRGIHLAGGSIPLKNPDDTSRVYSSCLLFGPDGNRLCRYDKIHLFRYRGGSQRFDETDTITPGDQVCAVDTPLGRIGLSICYDLRFPEIYRAMNRPDIILAPSAFIPVTGAVHWQLLLTARAVENLCTVVGAAQAGEHPGQRKTYGHSMVIDPWGNIQAHAEQSTAQVIIGEHDSEKMQTHRQQLPALDNRRF